MISLGPSQGEKYQPSQFFWLFLALALDTPHILGSPSILGKLDSWVMLAGNISSSFSLVIIHTECFPYTQLTVPTILDLWEVDTPL